MYKLRTAGFIFLALCLIVILGTVQTNYMAREQISASQDDLLQQLKTKIYKKAAKSETVPAAAENTRRIQPEDPAKYGMAVISRHESPATLNQWESKLSAMFDKHGVFESEEAQKVLSQLKVNARDHEKYMQQLDELIREGEQKLKENPLNAQSEQMLQNLYKTKAVGNILSGRITLEPAPSVLEESVPLQENPTVPPQP